MDEPQAFIALGTNVPFDGLSGAALLGRAAAAVQAEGFMRRAASSVWLTSAWPPSDQPDYYNAVLAVDPGGRSPQALYAALRKIEERFGRQRRDRWAARTLDLDIIAMDGFVGAFGEVELPHPRMADRTFVLAPLAEITLAWRHPSLGLTADKLLATAPEEQQSRRVGRLPDG